MSRDIKFRAWDTETNKYVEDVYIGDRRMPSNALDWYDFEQWTGLKDKNGMPVYEGDIVLNEDFVGNPDCVNKWEREVTWDDTNAAWAGIEGEVVTVLGNIHQHSHLLP